MENGKFSAEIEPRLLLMAADFIANTPLLSGLPLGVDVGFRGYVVDGVARMYEEVEALLADHPVGTQHAFWSDIRLTNELTETDPNRTTITKTIAVIGTKLDKSISLESVFTDPDDWLKFWRDLEAKCQHESN